MIRVDEVEVVQQLPRERIACAVHHLDAEAVQRAGRWDLERGHGRLGDHVMGRIGRQVHRRELDHQGAGPLVEENARGTGVGGSRETAPVSCAQHHEQGERP